MACLTYFPCLSSGVDCISCPSSGSESSVDLKRVNPHTSERSIFRESTTNRTKRTYWLHRLHHFQSTFSKAKWALQAKCRLLSTLGWMHRLHQHMFVPFVPILGRHNNPTVQKQVMKMILRHMRRPALESKKQKMEGTEIKWITASGGTVLGLLSGCLCSRLCLNYTKDSVK